MATKYQNLSEYNPDILPGREILQQQKYAIAVADWNPQITHTLLEGAINTLVQHGVNLKNINVVHVPGTFELTWAAKEFQNRFDINSAMENKKHTYDAVIALGCVVQGETPHFEYVCQGVTQGITALNTVPNRCPVIFGVLTTSNMEQAFDRAGGKHGNKGVEAAITAIKMANIVW